MSGHKSFNQIKQQKGKVMNNSIINREIRQFNAETAQLEDMIVGAAIGKLIRTEYEHRNLPVPEYIDDFNRKVATAIDTQTREAKLLELREINAEEERLMPASEKRDRLRARKAALEQDLAGVK